MKATAQVQKLKSENCKHTIIRNLSRIMDIRIVDIDVERKTRSLVYDTVLAFEKAKR
jgi:copper chaperone CopZ